MEECLIYGPHFASEVFSLLRNKTVCQWHSTVKSLLHGMPTLWKILSFSKHYAFLFCLQMRRFVRLHISIIAALQNNTIIRNT